ncbi:hypothetical protein B0H65DRAFT_574861 [Neurospora tetraspora]|uniref:Uncharacterized protein n=1 Tax=Neurospora tetraspora TaxID=94610 RepID=A0AAE0JG15_9PEZI|nr:hypothetical protein B0H65DRAFT_574861 [Neurospora tetraspora]
MRPLDERPAFLPTLGNIVGSAASVGNAMMGVAFYEAGVVHFWLQAMRGMRISDFYNHWASPINVVGAVMALCHGRAVRMSLVCLLVTATMFARTPIIHSAYHTETASIPFFGIAAVDMTPNVTHYGVLPSSMAATSLNAFRGLQANQPIMFGEDVCDNCTLNALGLGWNAKCWSFHAGSYDFEDPILDARFDSVTYDLFKIDITDSRIYMAQTGLESASVLCANLKMAIDVRGRMTKFEPNNVIESVETYPRYPFELEYQMYPGLNRVFHVHDNRFVHLGSVGRTMFNTHLDATYKEEKV